MHDVRGAAGRGTLLPRGARRQRASRTLLPPERRVTEVVCIVGEDRRDNVEGVVAYLIEMQNAAADARTRKSKFHNMRLAKQFATALRRMTAVADKNPLRDELRPHLDFVKGVSAAWTHMAEMEPVRPRPNAYAKALAADVALVVCQQCGIEPTITVGGKFFRIAAALYGDTRADLSHHCRAALRAGREGSARRG